MAKNSLNDWSTTVALNTDIAGTNIDVGCAPQDVGVYMRTAMAQIAYAVQGSGGAIPDTWNVGTIIASTGTLSGLMTAGTITSAGTITGGRIATSGTAAANIVNASSLVWVGTIGGSLPGYGGGTGLVAFSDGTYSNGRTGALDSHFTQRDTAGNYAVFYYGNLSSLPTGVGSISTNGSTTSFNTSCDYRLKMNVRLLSGASEIIAALRPVTFDWIGSDRSGVGFIAHELQAIVPEAVTGEKDAVDANGRIRPQQVDQSKLIPYMVAEIQALRAEIELLKGRQP